MGKIETLKFSIWERILTYQLVEEIFKHKSRELLWPWPNDRQIYKVKGDKLIIVKKTLEKKPSSKMEINGLEGQVVNKDIYIQKGMSELIIRIKSSAKKGQKGEICAKKDNHGV